MRESLRIAGAYIGVVVGAGFASGQEVLQFFTSFSWYGFLGVVVAMVLFMFLGAQILQIGSQLQTQSHEQFFYHLYGKVLGRIVDIIIVFFLFGVTTVMIAGSGALFEQQFGMSSVMGSFLFTILIVVTLFLNVRDLISVISSVTPFLMGLILLITVYALMTSDLNSGMLERSLEMYTPVVPSWLLGAILYVTFNIAAAVAVIAIIGGTTERLEVARWGGVFGGIGLGVLLLLIHVAIFLNLDKLAGVALPTLFLASTISPVVGLLMAIALLGMVFNTGVGMVYAFAARFVRSETRGFYALCIFVSAVAFVTSLVGFTELVRTVYPLTGFVGILLILVLFFAYFRRRFIKGDS